MLAFMCFSTLWSFGNVLNGFMYFNGTQVIFSWILMFALYFVPYALMVGELGSAFKNSGGGVRSWIPETTGAKAAYYAGWTYWACHVTYIGSQGLRRLKGAELDDFSECGEVCILSHPGGTAGDVRRTAVFLLGGQAGD